MRAAAPPVFVRSLTQTTWLTVFSVVYFGNGAGAAFRTARSVAVGVAGDTLQLAGATSLAPSSTSWFQTATRRSCAAAATAAAGAATAGAPGQRE